MTLLFFVLTTLLFFIYKKKNKTYYISLFFINLFVLILVTINPDLNEKYNLKQILYFFDHANVFVILCIINLILLIFIIFDRVEKRTYRIMYCVFAIVATFIICLILLAINIFLIKEPLKNNFEGYVFNDSKNPLESVKVIDRNSNTSVLTDKKGFFKLKRKDEIDNESNLFFTKNGYKDSLLLIKVNSYHPPSSSFIFLRNESDTLKMVEKE